MAINKSFNGTTYSIPTTAGENGWTSLTNFLQALADYAGLKTTQTFTIRTATTTPVTVSATSDYCVNVALSVAGASAVTLPTGAQGQVFVVLDGSRNSATYNITVSGTGGQTINGSASYVMASNGQAAMFQFSGTEWKVLSEYLGASINATKIGAGSVSNTEFGYLDGVTSAIQTQLDAKAAASGGTLTSPTLITPALGTPASGTLTNCTGLPIVAGTTGTLSVARGGTGLTALGSANQVLKVNGAGTALVFDASGSGDVVGPASSTDNAIVRFDSTTGKLVQNSGVTIDDSNNMSAASYTATGGTAANNTMYVASNVLRFRGGTSGLGFNNSSGTEIGSVNSANVWTLGPSASTATNCVVNGAASVTHGVVFPASQNAVANANTLDDYEEGTFTPTLTASVTNPTNYGQNGRYTKIGNLVHVEIYITFDGTSTFGSGYYTISGLPFATAATHIVTGWGTLFKSGSGWYEATMEIPAGGSGSSLIYTQTNTYVTQASPNTWNSGSYFKYQFTYRVA